MNLLFLIVSLVSVVVLTAQGVLIKRFGDKRPNAEITYTFATAVCAFVLFGIIALVSKSQFNMQSLPYSLFFAVCYAGSTITYVLAVGCGSLALTTTIHSFALIIPTVLGFLVWGEPINAFKIVGIVLFAAALLLMGEKAEKGERLLSTKWIILMIISFFCEGLAPVAIKLHSIALGEETASACNDVFMVMAYAMAFAGIFAAAVLREGKIRIPCENGKTKNFMLDSLKIALPLASLGGICNGLYNLMNTVVANNKLDVSVFYPVISAGQLILTCVIAVVFFREKLSLKQIAAIFCGVVAIVLLNM
ncbi:MAG: EamA family transporter [Clostridia bacterium]|nr:EamA family transporter [Clostridia bacterium]